jgi:hypothetical protein
VLERFEPRCISVMPLSESVPRWSKSRSASGEERRRPEFVLSPCRPADEVETVTSCAREGQTKTST